MNSCILTGRLTAMPELKTTQSGIAVCRFRIAVKRPYSKSEENSTDFINVVTWKNNAEYVGRYLTKGQLIAVNGSVQVRRNNKDGKTTEFVEIVAEKVESLEPKRSGTMNQELSEQVNDSVFEVSGFTNDEGSLIELGSDEDLPF